MTSIISMLVWVLMGAVLVSGIVMATSGSFWLLGVGVLMFIAAVTKWGILPHH